MNAVLYFEEQMHWLGKRLEINDGHDRYANMEIKFIA
jgi:hypothetical protein